MTAARATAASFTRVASATAVLALVAGCTTSAPPMAADPLPPEPLASTDMAPSIDAQPQAQAGANPWITTTDDPYTPSPDDGGVWNQGVTPVEGAFPDVFFGYSGQSSMRKDPEFGMFGELASDTAGPAASTLPDDPGENLRQVSFSFAGGDFDPVISRDGQRLFFASTAHRPTSDIYVKNIDGRAITQLTTDPANDVMPAVSPDGARIAFASNRAGSWDLYLMNSTGGQAVQLTGESSQELHPSWSPDGKFLAFCRLGEKSGRWEIWVTEADRPAVRHFLTYGLFPDWHPTGSKIAFQRSREHGDRFFSIWTIDYTSGEATNLTEIASNPKSALINPTWSPDGEYLAATAVLEPNAGLAGQPPSFADIWIVQAEGGGRANLTGGKFVNLMPTWGPGNAVFFVSDRGGRNNVWATQSEQAMLAARGGQSPSFAKQNPMTPMGQVQPAGAHADKPAHADAHHAQPMDDHADEPTFEPEIANVPTDDQEHSSHP